MGGALTLGYACGDNALNPNDVDAGDLLPIPPLLEGEVLAGERVFRLQLQQGQMEWVTGMPTVTYGVNGPYLGPTLRLRRGERIRIEVDNQLNEASTLHWHGLEVPAASDGGPYQLVAAGATWTSQFSVVQRACTAWYHPHRMHATARQAYMGLAGLLLVEDDTAFTLPHTYGIDDLPLVIQDRRLAADGTHPYSPGREPSMHDHMAGLRGEIMLINGKREPRAHVNRGWVRLRLLNGSNARNYNIGFSDNRDFSLIASDGGLLAQATTLNRILLSPGERAEVLVNFSDDAAGTMLDLVSYSGEVASMLFAGMMGNNIADSLDRRTFRLMGFSIDEARSSLTPAFQYTALPPIDLAEASMTRDIVMAMGQGAVTLNGAQMTDLNTVPAALDLHIPVGSKELWRVRNTSGMAHPLHLHNRHFRVVEVEGAPPPPALAGWKDTVLIPPASTVRILADFQGTADAAHPYMFHCHILEHEDMGMMGRFYLMPT